MHISDGSSDVCSSDLGQLSSAPPPYLAEGASGRGGAGELAGIPQPGGAGTARSNRQSRASLQISHDRRRSSLPFKARRSAERRGGTEGYLSGRLRGSQYHIKQKNNTT